MELFAMNFLVIFLVSSMLINLSKSEDLENIAYNKATRQSGAWGKLSSDLAVDGDKSQRVDTCAHPYTLDSDLDPSIEYESPAWWTVDLSSNDDPPSYYYIHYVTIYQRKCCPKRTAILYIRVGNDSNIHNHTGCGSLTEREMYVANVTCDPAFPVRYLSIMHEEEPYLGLCEVEVMGFKSVPSVCRNGTFGEKCMKECHCLDNAVCDKQSGKCPSDCAYSHYGEDCQKELPTVFNFAAYNVSHDHMYVKYDADTKGHTSVTYVLEVNGRISNNFSESDGRLTGLSPATTYRLRILPYVESDGIYGQSSVDIDVTTSNSPATTTMVTTSSSTTTTTTIAKVSTSAIQTSTATSSTASSASTSTTITKTISPSSTSATRRSEETTQIDNTANDQSSTNPSTTERSKNEVAPVTIAGGNAGMIAGIVIAVLVVLIIILIVAFLLIKRKQDGKDSSEQPYFKWIPGFIQGMKKSKSSDTPSIDPSTPVVVVDQEDYYEPPTPNASPSTLKRQIQDANDKYTNITQRPAIKISELPQYIQTRKQKPDGFKDEYKILPSGPTAAWLIGNKLENKTKNRFLNIRAYDQSRVVLPTIDDDIHSDYINADYITGYGGKEKAYIAAQGPKKSTIIDMWRMIWESKTNRIVMVTNLIEGGKMKCERYWPEKDTETYGNIEVTILNQDTYSAYVIRTLNVMCGGDSRRIRQFHFTGWPDHGVPTVATDLLEFRRRIRTYDNGSTGPILIHCSAGVGRTGTFIAVDFSLDQAEAENEVNVWSVTNKMRFERVNMIQTLDQYIFVYDALYEAILSGDTLMDSARFKEEYARLCREDPETKQSLLDHQFEILGTLKNTKQDEKLVGLQDDNVKKNRIKDIVPNNRFRPFLSTQVEDTTSYINAVYVDSFLKKHAFIATQMPMPKTVVDLWRLIYDHQSTCIVMLNEYDTKDSTSAIYWPEDKESKLQFGPIEVSLEDVNTDIEGLTRRTFSVQNLKVKRTPATVTQFQLTCWPKEEDLPTNCNVLFETINLIEKWQQKNNNVSAVTFHDNNGASRCGLLIALIYALEQLKVDQQVDVFRCVKQIRVPRHQFIVDLNQYKFLHDMIIEYMNQFSDYSNFN